MYALWLVIALFATGTADGEQRTYTFDEDPVRLGVLALASGRVDEAKQQFQEAIANEHDIPQATWGLAEVAVREGRYEDAEPLYRSAMQLRGEKSFPEARAGLGLLLLRFGRDAEAAQEFARALEEKPNLWTALYGSARRLLADSKLAEAKQLLDKGSGIKGLREREDLFHHGMALYYMAQNEVPAAEKAALIALTLNPSDPEYATLVAAIYAQRQAPTLAIDVYEKALAMPGLTKTAPMLHALGTLYRDVERYNDARDSFQEAVKTDSTFAPAVRDLAHLYYLAKQYERAAQVYLRYVQLVADDVDALVELATSCNEIGRYAQSRAAAGAALHLDASRTDARFALARAGIHSKDDEAKAEAVRLYAELPDSADWTTADLVALATYQINTKQYSDADLNLQRAIALDAEVPEAHFQRGLLRMRTGDAPGAVTHMERAVALAPESVLYQLNLGIAHFQAGQIEAAITPFRKTVQLNEGLTIARVLLAQALLTTGELGEAEEEYRRVLESTPDEPRALRGLGFCSIRKANYDAALRLYEKATRVEPANADGWAGLGNANLGLKKWNEAEKAFLRATSIDPGNVSLKKGMELLAQAREDVQRAP